MAREKTEVRERGNGWKIQEEKRGEEGQEEKSPRELTKRYEKNENILKQSGLYVKCRMPVEEGIRMAEIYSADSKQIHRRVIGS